MRINDLSKDYYSIIFLKSAATHKNNKMAQTYKKSGLVVAIDLFRLDGLMAAFAKLKDKAINLMKKLYLIISHMTRTALKYILVLNVLTIFGITAPSHAESQDKEQENTMGHEMVSITVKTDYNEGGELHLNVPAHRTTGAIPQEKKGGSRHPAKLVVQNGIYSGIQTCKRPQSKNKKGISSVKSGALKAEKCLPHYNSDDFTYQVRGYDSNLIYGSARHNFLMDNKVRRDLEDLNLVYKNKSIQDELNNNSNQNRYVIDISRFSVADSPTRQSANHRPFLLSINSSIRYSQKSFIVKTKKKKALLSWGLVGCYGGNKPVYCELLAPYREAFVIYKRIYFSKDEHSYVEKIQQNFIDLNNIFEQDLQLR